MSRYTVPLAHPCHEFQELHATPSPISAEGVIEVLEGTGLDSAILSHHNPRWERLRAGLDRTVDLRALYRGALVGGAIGDALTRKNEGP